MPFGLGSALGLGLGFGGLLGPLCSLSPVPPVLRIDFVGGGALAIGEAANAGEVAVGGVFGTGTFTQSFEDPASTGKGGTAGPMIFVSANLCICGCLGGVINDSNSRLKLKSGDLDEGE